MRCDRCGTEMIFPDVHGPGKCDLIATESAKAGILEAIQAAKDPTAVFAAFKAIPPPAGRLDRSAIRDQLMRILKESKVVTSAADAVDAWLSTGEAEAGAAQGTEFEVRDVEPADDPVVGADLLADIEHYFRRFAVISDEQALAVSLWTMFTYGLDHFYISPILCFTSPTPRCGKSTMLELVGALSYRSIPASNMTSATLFRTIEKYHPTLLVDEIDNLAKSNDEIRGLLNAAHRKELAYVLRCVGETDEVRVFSTWSPKAFTLLKSLSEQLDDRSIIIEMAMKSVGVAIDDPDPEVYRPLADPLQRRIRRFMLDHGNEFQAYRVPRETGLDLRVRDNWRPPLAIANAIGPDTLQRATKAALVLTKSSASASEHYRVLLLRHIREAFGDKDRIHTADLLQALVDRDDGPWPRWWGADVEADRLKGVGSKLHKELAAFKKADGNPIDSDKIRIGEKSLQGYYRADFEEAWSRYLSESPGTSENDGTNGTHGTLQVKEGVSKAPSTSDVPSVPSVPSSDGTAGGSPSEQPELPKVAAESNGFKPGDIVRLDRYRGRRFKVKNVDGPAVDCWELDHGMAGAQHTFMSDEVILVRPKEGE